MTCVVYLPYELNISEYSSLERSRKHIIIISLKAPLQGGARNGGNSTKLAPFIWLLEVGQAKCHAIFYVFGPAIIIVTI